MHVFAVGKNDLVNSWNLIEGGIANPNIGSSSVDVANCKMWPNVISPRRPPKIHKCKYYSMLNY